MYKEKFKNANWTNQIGRDIKSNNNRKKIIEIEDVTKGGRPMPS